MLDKKQKYLQIALNSTLDEAERIINQIPLDKRIIIEAGTPLIKAYGVEAIRKIRFWWEQRILKTAGPQIFKSFKNIKQELRKKVSANKGTFVEKIGRYLESSEKDSNRGDRNSNIFSFTPYIVADLKCMDRGKREVEIAREGGANAAVVLGQAPVETIDAFIEECEKQGLDSMVDMMNTEYSLNILRQLKKIPSVVIIHRGVDEETFNPESEIPFHEIHRIKENYDIMIAVAGGDTFQEIQRAIFNDADIVVVWKSFYQSTAETAKLAEEFLKEIR